MKAALDAIKARSAELNSPITDADAGALGSLMAGGDLSADSISETKFNATLAQIALGTKEQFAMMVNMAKMMGKGDRGVSAAAFGMAAKMAATAAGATTANHCSACGTVETSKHRLTTCQKCHATQYCNRKCEKEHWVGGHKKECKK